MAVFKIANCNTVKYDIVPTICKSTDTYTLCFDTKLPLYTK